MKENDEPEAGSGRAPMLLALVVVVIAGAVVLLLHDPSVSRSERPGPALRSFVSAEPAALTSAPVPPLRRTAAPALPISGPATSRPPTARIALPVYRLPRGPGRRLPLRVDLDAGGSTDPDRQRLRYRWDLDGDGDVDEGVVRPDPTVTFTRPGPVRVSVVVLDGTGLRDRAGLVVRPGRQWATAPAGRVPDRAAHRQRTPQR